MKTRYRILAIAALLLQIWVLNGLGPYMRYLPYLGLWGVIFYPPSLNRNLYLIFAFIFGLIIDFSMGTGGIFAASAVTFAFLRPAVLRFFFPDRSVKVPEFPQWTFKNLFLYILIASFFTTVFVYLADTFSPGYLFRQKYHVFFHSLANAFFYSVYTFLFYWDNQYKTR